MIRDHRDGQAPRNAGNPPPISRAFLSLAMLLAILFVAFGSLMPLTLAGSWTEFRRALQAGMTLHIEPPILATVTERLLVFLPLGFLISLHLGYFDRRRRTLAAAVLTILIALAIEILQAAVVGRHPRLSDLLLAMLFGSVGAAVGAALQRTNGTPLDDGRRRTARADSGGGGTTAGLSQSAIRSALIGGLALCNLAMLAILTTTHSGASISGWNCSYPLLIGNEATRDRPWRGKIGGLAIYGRVPSKSVLTALGRLPMTANQSEARRRAGALVVYAFDAVEGRRVPDLGLGSANGALDAEIAGPGRWSLAQGAIDIHGPALIQSNAVARELCEQIARSQAFAVEIEFASADLRQSGPARIVSMSQDPMQRNFTLAQDVGALILRVRTPRSGSNGVRLPIRTADGAITGGWQHVWATYGGGSGDIFVDGARATDTIADHRQLLLNEETAVPVSHIAALLLFASGAMAALLFAGRQFVSTLLMGYTLAAAQPLLCALVLQAWYGHEFDWALLVAAILAPCAGSVVGWTLLRRHARPALAATTQAAD